MQRHQQISPLPPQLKSDRPHRRVRFPSSLQSSTRHPIRSQRPYLPQSSRFSHLCPRSRSRSSWLGPRSTARRLCRSASLCLSSSLIPRLPVSPKTETTRLVNSTHSTVSSSCRHFLRSPLPSVTFTVSSVTPPEPTAALETKSKVFTPDVAPASPAAQGSQAHLAPGPPESAPVQTTQKAGTKVRPGSQTC